jgi:SEC-C motif-containing protein
MLAEQPCPCGSTHIFSKCCGPFLTYQDKPKTAEQLMRSRYCAFVTENEAYLLFTWQPSKRPKKIDFDQNTKWLGLKIKKCTAGTAADTKGWVEFVARFKIAGKAERIEELSYFIKDGQQWLYVAANEKPLEQSL